jgi:hypothetical protein
MLWMPIHHAPLHCSWACCACPWHVRNILCVPNSVMLTATLVPKPVFRRLKHWDISLYDHVKLKIKRTICNSIMWFIFNLQRKINYEEIAWEYVHKYLNNSQMNTSFVSWKVKAAKQFLPLLTHSDMTNA